MSGNRRTEEPGSAPVEGRRFAFGANWRRFLRGLNEERVAMARDSLRSMLSVEDLSGRTFLDVGSGSGIFSLAAAQLGAARVHSFDFDSDSVECTRELRRRFHPAMENWTVERGDCLDRAYLESLGRFDVVYAWGVLHHTGHLWDAVENVSNSVADNGQIFIALYNDQKWVSDFWRRVKKTYCSGALGRWSVSALFLPMMVATRLGADLVMRRSPLTRYRRPRARGMSEFRDLVDWLGGFPFEVAGPDSVFRFFRDRGLELEEMVTTSGSGCNEYVARRPSR